MRSKSPPYRKKGEGWARARRSTAMARFSALWSFRATRLTQPRHGRCDGITEAGRMGSAEKEKIRNEYAICGFACRSRLHGAGRG